MRSRPTSRISIPKTSASSRRDAAGLAALAITILAVPAPAPAQQVTIVGEVVRHGQGGTLPLAGGWVVLHRITLDGGAPADSVRTDSQGRFRVRAAADSGTVLLVSARHMGVAYFGAPVHGFRGPVDTLDAIEVFDTTFGRPAIAVRQRHLVLQATADQRVDVVDILEFGNDGLTTRVADTTGPPTWAGRVAAGADQLRVGDGDFSPDAVVQRGDSLLVYGPIPPGIRQLSVAYAVPSKLADFTATLDEPVASLAVLVEGDQPVRVEPLEALGTRSAEGRTFQTFRGRDLRSGTVIRVRATGGWSTLDVALAGLVALMVTALGWAALRLRMRPAPAGDVRRADALAAEIAGLDARYQGREPDVPAAEWQGYLERRRQLKSELKAALAEEAEHP